jgi:hypothetical protein
LFTWGGGQIQTSPFKFNVNLDGQIDAVVWATHVDLQPILSRITQGRAKGSGKLSGRLPITVNWPRVLVSEGVLEAETAGTIQLGDATATFTDVLEKSDPRYGKQGPMASIKDRIVEAMRDFHYELLHAKFWVDPNGKTVVSLSLKGQGVSGQRQPLDIVLNLHGLEEGLNSYLAARSRVMDIGR